MRCGSIEAGCQTFVGVGIYVLPVSLCCSPHTDRMKLTSFGGSAATDVDMVATVIATTIKNAHIDVFKDSFMVGMFRQGQLVVWVARDRENSVLGWNIL